MAPKAGAKGGTKGKGAVKDEAKGKATVKNETKEKSGSSAKVKGAQSIHVRHILCEKHARKEEALAKSREGAHFDVVAREFSEDKARQGGVLGWKTKGSLLPEFEKVAFELETSTPGHPRYGEAKTSEGYHIIMVDERK